MITKNPSPASKVNKFKEYARRITEHHFGTRPRRIGFKPSGLTNFVFGVSHKDGDFIVRISPEAAALNLFIKEQWAQKAAQKAGVPTAEILEVGSSVVPVPYMVTRHVEGETATSHPKRSEILRELGSLAAKINGIRTKGFGSTFDWSNNLLSRNDLWKSYLQNEFNFEAKLDVLEDLRVATPRQTRLLRKTFKDAAGLNARSALNHGDLRLKNVLADREGKITALLDWGSAISNLAPHWEFSLALHDLGIDEKQHFIEGYGIKPKQLADAAPLVKAFNMLNYIPEIERAAREKDKTALDRIKARFSGIFDLYSVV